MSKTEAWTQFKVGEPSDTPHPFQPTRCPFEYVYHVAHVPDALQILDDGKIRSSLVYDESRLNTKRTCVSWVSPNYWHLGSIYGNVCFSFEWRRLVEGKRIYWVESLRTERQTIVRFLLSSERFKDEPLTAFDPRKGDGPLYHDTDTDIWCYNGTITNEYMILADLPLERCSGITFWDHHRTCCKRKGHCRDLRRKAEDAGAMVLARVIARNQPLPPQVFADSSDPTNLDGEVEDALYRLFGDLTDRSAPRGKTALSGPAQTELMRGILLAHSFKLDKQVRALRALFPNKRLLREAFRGCAENFFRGMSFRLEFNETRQ